MTKYAVDSSGNYIGGFDGLEPPLGSMEIPKPPEQGDSVYLAQLNDQIAVLRAQLL